VHRALDRLRVGALLETRSKMIYVILDRMRRFWSMDFGVNNQNSLALFQTY
jgi:hypothetical protein